MVSQEVQDIQKANGRMEDAISKIRGSIDKIGFEVSEVKRGWKGTANTAFTNASIVWSDEAAKLNRALDDIQEKIKGSITKYGRTNETVADALGKAVQPGRPPVTTL